jgi:hypothetical protein
MAVKTDRTGMTQLGNGQWVSSTPTPPSAPVAAKPNPPTTGVVPPVKPVTPNPVVNKPMAATPPVQNSATNTSGVAPTLGYGSGGTYGSTPGLGQAYAANQALISTDAGKQSEIDRTLQVIKDRQAQGMDVTDQNKYLSVNLGYKPPQQEVQTQALPSGGYMPRDAVTNVRSSSELQQSSGDSLAIERAALLNAINTQMGSIKNNAQYANQLTNDSRTLQDFSRTQSANPFANMGKRSFEEGLIGRQRSMDDNTRNNELNTQLNSLSTEIADFDKLAPERQREIYNKLLTMERDFGLNVGQLTGNYPSGTNGRTLAGNAQDYAQYADNRDFEYGAGRDVVADDQWSKQFEEDKSRYGEQFAYQKARDKITDANDKRDFDEQVKQNGVAQAVSWYNAKTSRQSSNNAAGNANFSKLMDVFSATGKAPAGLEGYGIPAGTAYKSDSASGKIPYQNSPDFASDVSDITSGKVTLDKVKASSQALIEEYGYDGYLALLKAATPEE